MTCPCGRRLFTKQNWLTYLCTAGHEVDFDELERKGVTPGTLRWRRLCRALRRSWGMSATELQR